MTGVKQIARATPYASSDDFRKVFDEHMNSLYLLAFLLTADEGKAEQCFVSGLEDAVEGNPVFKEWAHSWARRAVILNAVRVISPRPADGNGGARSDSDQVRNDSKALPFPQQAAEIAAVLALEPFARFVYIITVLEHRSDQECSILLGCMRRDVLSARTRAYQQLASEAATHLQPTAGPENPRSHRSRTPGISLVIPRRLATSS